MIRPRKIEGEVKPSEEIEETVEQGTEVDEIDFRKKYAKASRELVTQRLDIPLSSVATMIENQIKLDPEFQRHNIWNRTQQSKFVESIIMNVPVPPVFLAEDDYSEYVVVDGRQRLTAVVEYMRGNYSLESLEVFSELNGRRYDDLTGEFEVYRRALWRRFLPAVVILAESDDDIKFDVFERLNSLGVKLSAMELRNSIFRGPLIAMLHSLATDKSFKLAWGIPQSQEQVNQHRVYTQMYDVELVLRYFALNDYNSFQGRYKQVFTQFCRDHKQDAPEKIAALANDFRATYACAIRLFGKDKCFRKYQNSGDNWKRKGCGRSVLKVMPQPETLTLGRIVGFAPA